jgi:RHS repeat-associated protein
VADQPVSDSVDRGGIQAGASPFAVPQLALPKGGGAVRGIGETFKAGSVTGTGTLTVPIAVSPGRSNFGPNLSLTYDSGSGNGPFGLGWDLGLPCVARRTDRGLPRYADSAESDIFILSGAEDLVPALVQNGQGRWVVDNFTRDGYVVTRYRPRTEGLFARIERWVRTGDGDTYWRAISRDNVTTYYGKDRASRVADPDDAGRVFRWLICESHDDRGNVVIYDYAAEDSANVDAGQSGERNRSPAGRAANRYVKRIRYGNVPSLLVQPDVARLAWRFEVVFDYGEGHFAARPPDASGRVFATASPAASRPWPVRRDPFSTYRPGFEVRTYRLCRRVLMFHHFPDELGAPDTLVRATEFTHQETPVASYLTAITQSGFTAQADGTYLVKSLPPLELEYSAAVVNLQVKDVDPDDLADLSVSPEGPRYRWVDLDSEGLQGILAEEDGGWLYKRNLSALTFDAGDGSNGPTVQARFDGASEVASLPGFAGEAVPRHQFLDLAGDGRLDCVVLEAPDTGYYKRTSDEGWEPFRPLAAAPVADWSDPNLRFIDLDGDGLSDVLITADNVLTWHPSLAEEGFGPATRVPRDFDEEKGPAVVFAEPLQTIFLADMSGDGLTDVVRVRNGEVCYWPNLGYGRFGPKVTMDGAPVLEPPELFDGRRVRLADIDGSGTTDLVYLASDGPRLYFNQSGNVWSDPEPLPTFPHVDDVSDVHVMDLLGTGTACLVWASPLPGDERHALRYIDLMGGQKPHLLTVARNNLGAETRVAYAPSTKFYLADRLAGRPWVTRLPFPVQVVERVETLDRVSRNRFVSRYAYHHGYFDPDEREFRGFGTVEQRDTEELGVLAGGTLPGAANVDEASFVPPVVTKTWYHTGAFALGPSVVREFDAEYYRESAPPPAGAGLTDAQAEAMRLPDSSLPADLSGEELREALRALKGAMLRQEVYADDGTAAAGRPYRVSERNYTIRRVQPLADNRHAVFFTHSRESLDFQYERAFYRVGARQLADPRVAQVLVLAVDDYGNELLSARVAYGRRHDDPDPLLTVDDRAAQKRVLVTCTASAYSNAILADTDYRTPLPSETRTYELLKVAPVRNDPDVTNLFAFAELASLIAQAGDGQHDLPYDDVDGAGATANHPYRRLVGHARTLYRKDDLTLALPLGTLEARALPFRGYRLAFTPGLLGLYVRGAENLLPSPATVLGGEGGYASGDTLSGQGLFPAGDRPRAWWAPTGQVFYSPRAADTAAQELAQARAHFFLARRVRDPFGNDTTVTYDAHDLLLLETQDALGNRMTAGDRAANGTVTNRNDYRVLRPALTTDANGNRAAVAYDALGLVAATAVMGKLAENLGDSLAGLQADLTQSNIDQFFSNPKGAPALTLLGSATSRVVYDLGRFVRIPGAASPTYAATIARETHVSDLGPGQATKVQVGFSFSDGFGRVVQQKAQAEPGPVTPGGPAVNPRWVGSGWTVFNNKGLPVRQYEPFFDNTHDFAFGATVGVSPVLCYDPLGRAAVTLRPNHSLEKVVFDAWRQTAWDVNDTVLIADPTADPDAGPFFRRLRAADFSPTWYSARSGGALGADEQDAAQKAADHANTPGTTFLDALGRAFLSVAFNRTRTNGSSVEEHYRTTSKLDVEGNRRAVTDALGRVVMTYDYNMLGAQPHQRSADAGERWALNDAAGQPMRVWDSRGHNLRTAYDALRRPTGLFVSTGGGGEILAERNVYGEGQPNDQALNLRGRVAQRYDNAGVVVNQRSDFKGNLLSSSRRLRQGYKDQADWSQTPALEAESFASSTRYDALNRPTQLVAPSSSGGSRFNVVQPGYNEANLLARVDAWLGQAAAPAALLDPATASAHLVARIDYNARGQRTAIARGNGATTAYDYEPDTFRLRRVRTTRASDGAVLQDLTYHYDPAGNVTQVRDGAQQTLYFNNQLVAPVASYVYDAVYRLSRASGRELIGLAAQPWTTFDDGPRMSQPLPTDAQAIRNYGESYQYDPVGNLLALAHTAANGNWTRTYAYDEPSATPTNNRLSSTTVAGTKEPFGYDPDGNVTSMPHLSAMSWDYKDRLQATRRSGGAAPTTYYVYDATGRRVRKVTEGAGGSKTKERIYLGDIFEVYREYGGGGAITLERQTLHALDGARRVALVETTTVNAAAPGSVPQTATRYQLDNHLGSAVLELDENAAVISYEEYYPYGSTSFQAGRSAAEVSLKRYRFTGKERDEETGFYYHGARYCAPWLGRWVSCDPAGMVDGTSLYLYVRDNPVRLRDPDGTQAKPPNIDPRDRKPEAKGPQGENKAPQEKKPEQKKQEEKKEEEKKEEEKKKPQAPIYNAGPTQTAGVAKNVPVDTWNTEINASVGAASPANQTAGAQVVPGVTAHVRRRTGENTEQGLLGNVGGYAPVNRRFQLPQYSGYTGSLGYTYHYGQTFDPDATTTQSVHGFYGYGGLAWAPGPLATNPVLSGIYAYSIIGTSVGLDLNAGVVASAGGQVYGRDVYGFVNPFGSANLNIALPKDYSLNVEAGAGAGLGFGGAAGGTSADPSVPASLRLTGGIGIQKPVGDYTFGAEIVVSGEPKANIANPQQPGAPFAATLNLTISALGLPKPYPEPLR